jgi:peptidoglycan/xylan/chitin deacetylase (PgdA/CDA1 family)
MFYLVKSSWLIKKLYPQLVWEKNTDEKKLYLTFDDGPHLQATPFVLDVLKQYNAKATFFCIGKNVKAYPEIYERILNEGHKTGNHTYDHLNGWKTKNKNYLDNILLAAKYIDSNLFRPPYGKISKFQISLLQKNNTSPHILSHALPFEIIMWTVLSGDFDTSLAPRHCLQNVLLHTKAGSIIVFHDSAKAWERMSFALPKVLQYFSEKNYSFHTL